ncbi:uncharacterized protein LOC119078864 [Bradysia coprophila]|uniref:uncharacterized protein LOC119078864 n=1 Tax=Bradysia coprophila TaxID=38358 RepID=UPI00187DAEFF|nr:uncharacterized protein LOC119078864 [Bradysia coprophila]
MAKYIRSTATYTRLPIFYGDDGRRIKTIFVSNIRDRTTVESLEQKYSIYGPVQSCTLNYHTDSDERYAIVTMDYAYDASKILRDYPDEAKHLYSLLPKRMTRHTTRKESPKKEIVRKINRIEVPVIEIQLKECAKPCVATISRNDDVNVVESPKKSVTPAPRKRRVAKSTSSKVKERTAVKQSRNEIKLEAVTVSENKINEPPTVETINQTQGDAIAEVNPFTSLNDDCLISLFTFCDKLDLVNLAMVCERFRFIVFNYLRAKMSRVVDLNKIKSTDKLTVSEATKFLKFIDAVKNTQQLEVTMSGFVEQRDDLILEEILKCCGPKLVCIKFNGFSFMESFTSQWKHLLHGLTTLAFHQCILSANHFSELLTLCENLVVLCVTNSNSTGNDADDDIKVESRAFTCTKLKEFRLTSTRHCCKSSELIWLLENNPNLSVLQIQDVGDSVKLTGGVLKSIGKFEQLQDLAFSFRNFMCDLMINLCHLIQLKELKSLSLQCEWENISTFIRQLSQAANKQIERLSFECIDINTSFIKSIGRFRKLQYLKLENTVVNEPSQVVFEQSLMDLTYRLNNLSRFHCQLHLFTEDTLVQFIERMKRLEHFQITGLVMNLLLFMQIVSACGRRINGIKLNVVVDNYHYLNEYLDLIRSEYGNVIGIQSIYD